MTGHPKPAPRVKEKRARAKAALVRLVELQRAVWQRDSGRCRVCGTCVHDSPLGHLETRGHVHHVVYRSQGGKDSLDNLMLLCARHHREAHEHPADFTRVINQKGA